jgi:hypothetical protein
MHVRSWHRPFAVTAFGGTATVRADGMQRKLTAPRGS